MNSGAILERFEQLPFQVEVELGRLTMTLGQVFELQEGAVLRTDHAAGEPFVLRAGGVDLAKADIIVVNGSLSARIDKMIEKAKIPAGGDGSN